MNYTLRDPNGNVLLAVESSPVVAEADMKADLDKAAKACESAFDEVTKYQDAMAVMSSEGFGEQVKAVASKVWEKIKKFLISIGDFIKKVFSEIRLKRLEIGVKLFPKRFSELYTGTISSKYAVNDKTIEYTESIDRSVRLIVAFGDMWGSSGIGDKLNIGSHERELFRFSEYVKDNIDTLCDMQKEQYDILKHGKTYVRRDDQDFEEEIIPDIYSKKEFYALMDEYKSTVNKMTGEFKAGIDKINSHIVTNVDLIEDTGRAISGKLPKIGEMVNCGELISKIPFLKDMAGCKMAVNNLTELTADYKRYDKYLTDVHRYLLEKASKLSSLSDGIPTDSGLQQCLISSGNSILSSLKSVTANMTKLESSITDIETALASLKNTILDSKKYERVIDANYNNLEKLYDKHHDLETKW